MEINTNAITIQKMTKNGTLPRKSICLKLGYLKLETISNPALTVINAPIRFKVTDVSNK